MVYYGGATITGSLLPTRALGVKHTAIGVTTVCSVSSCNSTRIEAIHSTSNVDSTHHTSAKQSKHVN